MNTFNTSFHGKLYKEIGDILDLNCLTADLSTCFKGEYKPMFVDHLTMLNLLILVEQVIRLTPEQRKTFEVLEECMDECMFFRDLLKAAINLDFKNSSVHLMTILKFVNSDNNLIHEEIDNSSAERVVFQ